MNLLDGNGKPSMFTPILIATLGTCAELERENIQYRLNSGRRIYIERGGTLGRKKGSTKRLSVRTSDRVGLYFVRRR